MPLDGIGLQAHLDLRKGRVSAGQIRAFLREIEGLGLEAVITELDVKEADYAASAEHRDAAVADEVRRYLEIVLDSPAVKGVTTWGLSDRYSWLRVTNDELSAYSGMWKKRRWPRSQPRSSTRRHIFVETHVCCHSYRVGRLNSATSTP